jgi:subtilase family protein
MNARSHRLAAPVLSALLVVAIATCLLAATASALSPLPRADYGVRAACAPPSPGHAACLALKLVPRSAQARAHTHPLGVGTRSTRPASSAAEGAFGLTPSDLHSAYQLPSTTAGEQTIALVDAYNDLTAESDLKAYGEALGLPACTSGSGCFTKVNQRGETGALTLPFPKTSLELKLAEKGTARQQQEAAEAIGWGGEIALDIETAHAICQNCKILLVEAESPSYEDLEAAEATAERLGATEISNSWGGPELGETPTLESAGPFNHAGTVITASAGDYGYLEWATQEPSHEASFPASSPHVVAVGGTRLTLNASGHTWQSESVWNDAGVSKGVKEGYGADGGGCSGVFSAPVWQRSVAEWASVGCGERRAVADVAADADPYSGVAVYYSSRECESLHEGKLVHWCTYGGTSLSSPIIAASYALAGGAPGIEYPASLLYKNAGERPASLHDVFSGSNGECLKPFDEETGLSGCSIREQGKSCSLQAICLSRAGYDGPSGVGTPHGIAAFEPSPAPETEAQAAEHAAEVEAQRAAESVEAAQRLKEAEAEEAAQRALAEREAAERAAKGELAGTPVGTTSTSSAPPPPAPAPAAPVPLAPPTPKLSALALTRAAILALNRTRPRMSLLRFTFTINTAARVRVSLAVRRRTHGRTRWVLLRGSFTLAATSGRNGARLSGRTRLAAGTYRLTLQPLNGIARSIVLRIG